MPSSSFPAGTRAALLATGWHILHAPAGLTLAALRATGAPFKSDRYFERFAAVTDEARVAGGDVAYRPGLMPQSLNQTHQRAEALLGDLQPQLPRGVVARIAPAAVYVWLLVEHHRLHGEWLLDGQYTWAADHAGGASGTHLVVGVFGRDRPLVVSPLPEGTGRGVGVMPIVLPAGG
jgi:hypothetical protein